MGQFARASLNLGYFLKKPWQTAPSTMATIAILGTMDTKGEEHAFVADRIKKRGHEILVIDVGALGEPRLKPDIGRREVAAAAGVDLDTLVARRDRGETVAAMSKGAPLVLSRLAAGRQIDRVISLGGGGGTAIGTAAMAVIATGVRKGMGSALGP